MSAVQNWQNQQAQLAQSMTAPLQAGQTQQVAPAFAQQHPAQTAQKQYLQQVSQSRQQAEALADSMRQAALKSGKAAIGATQASIGATQNLKQINSGGRIQAKHPLDLLAIGIRGWKANKAQKKVDATAATAKQAAYAAQQAAAQQQKAESRAEWEYRREQEAMKPKEPQEMTKARMEAKFREERAIQRKAGVPEEAMQFSTMGMAGQSIWNEQQKADKDPEANKARAIHQFVTERNEQEEAGIDPADMKFSREAQNGQDYIAMGDRRSANAGTGKYGQVDLESGVDTGLQKDILSNEAGIKKLTRVEDGFKPEYFGVKGAAGGLLGKVQDIAGFSEGEMSKFNAERSEYLSSLYQFSNKLIKERSGAAVTAQEWERFKKEFPVGFMGAQEFKVRLAGYVEDMAAENTVKLRQGGWEIKDGVITENEDAPAMTDAQIAEITGKPVGGNAPAAYDPTAPMSATNRPPDGSISDDGMYTMTPEGWKPNG